MSDRWKKAKERLMEKLRHPRRRSRTPTSQDEASGDDSPRPDTSPTQMSYSLSPTEKSGSRFDDFRHSIFSRQSSTKSLGESSRSPGSQSDADQPGTSHQSGVRSREMQAIVDRGVERSWRDIRHTEITPIPNVSPQSRRGGSASESPGSAHDTSRQSDDWEQRAADAARARLRQRYSESYRPQSIGEYSVSDITKRMSLYDDDRTRHMSADTTSGTNTARRKLSRKLSDASKFFAKLSGKTDFLYVFGGNDLRGGRYTVERYDINKETWERVGVGMPHFAESYGVAVYQDWIWVIGGEIGTGRNKMAMSAVFSCEETIDEWQPEQGLNRARASLGVAELDDRLYVIGGKDGNDILDTAECYNSAKDKWILLPARLNRRRHDFGSTTYKGQIYVAGGYDGGIEPLRSVEVFSSKSKQWTVQENDLISRRRFLSLASMTPTLACTLYAIGGGNARDMEYLDTKTSTWKAIAGSDEGIEQRYHRGSTAIASDQKFIYFVGGSYKDKNPLVISEKSGRFVYCYDTFGEGWSQIHDMIERRSGAKAIVKYGCKPTSEAGIPSSYRPPPKSDNRNNQSNVTHGASTSPRDGGFHGIAEAPGQDDRSETQLSGSKVKRSGLEDRLLSDARQKTSQSARSKGIVPKTYRSSPAGSPRGARRNLGAPASSPRMARRKFATPIKESKSGIQSGARPKIPTHPKNSPGLRRKINTPTKTYQPGATAHTGWYYNDGKSPTTRRRHGQGGQSATRPKISVATSSRGDPIGVLFDARSPRMAWGSPSQEMHHNPDSSSHARRLLASPPSTDQHRSRADSSPKTGGYGARRRLGTPPSNVFHSVSPRAGRRNVTPPNLFRPIQRASPVGEHMMHGKEGQRELSDAAELPRSVVELGDYLYVFGGTNAERGTMERYNFRTEKWEAIDTLMPHSGSGCAVALFQGRAWIIGGSSAPACSHREVHAFHPEEELWRRAPPLRNGRQSLGAAVLGKKIFAVGGKFNERVLDSVETFGKEGRWKEDASLNAGRCGFGIAEHGGKLFVAGGADKFGYSIKTVEMYSNGMWSIGNRSMVTRRKLFGLTSACGAPASFNTLYALGGGHPEVMRNRAWEVLSEYDARRDRSGPAVASYGKHIYLIGGDRCQNYSIVKNRLVHVYDTTTGVWFDVDSMNDARSEFLAVVFYNCKIPKKF